MSHLFTTYDYREICGRHDCATSLVIDKNRPKTNSADAGTIAIDSCVTKLYAMQTYFLTVTRIHIFIIAIVTDTTIVAIILMSSANFASWNRNHNSPFKIYNLFYEPPRLAFKTPTFRSQIPTDLRTTIISRYSIT
jgi:hypothetical protein